MDYWDPAVTDGLAKNRAVILFNNAGVSSSSGQVPRVFRRLSRRESWPAVEAESDKAGDSRISS
jgi:hypothetical protein